MTDTVKVKVRDGWIVHDGNAVRGGGEVVDIDTETADEWLAAGWVETVKPEPAKATTAKPATKRTTVRKRP